MDFTDCNHECFAYPGTFLIDSNPTSTLAPFYLIEQTGYTSTFITPLHSFNGVYDSLVCGPISGIEAHINSEEYFHIFPNPVTDIFEITWTNILTEPLELSIYAFNGQLMHTESVSSARGSHILNAESFPPGIYLLEVKSEKERFSRKIVKL